MKQIVIGSDRADLRPIGCVLWAESNQLQEPLEVVRDQAVVLQAGHFEHVVRQLHLAGRRQHRSAVVNKLSE